MTRHHQHWPAPDEDDLFLPGCVIGGAVGLIVGAIMGFIAGVLVAGVWLAV